MIDPNAGQTNTVTQSPVNSQSIAQDYIIIDVNPNVSRAERAINLVSSGALGIDSESNLRQVANMVIELTPEETGFLFDRLSNQELQDFGEAMLASDFLGSNYGLNPSDRQAFFSHLAQDLPGGELARIGIAMGDPSNMSKAVSSHAQPGEQVQFIKELAPLADVTAQRSGNITSHEGNGAANAIIEVLGGLGGQPAADALGALTRAQLDTVMEAGQGKFSGTEAVGGNAAYWTGYRNDAAGVATILNAAARAEDTTTGVDQKARAFSVGTEQLTDIRASGATNAPAATDAVLDGLTNILKSNPSGILTELRGQASENTANSLTTYARTMFVAGRGEELGEIMGLLKEAGGADLVANFTNPAGDHANARNLGYFTNAITQGLDQVASARGTLMRNVDAIGGGIANVILGPFAPQIGVAVDEAIAIVAGDSADSFSNKQAQIADSFRVLAWPVSEKPDGTGASAFQDAVDSFNAERTNR